MMLSMTPLENRTAPRRVSPQMRRMLMKSFKMQGLTVNVDALKYLGHMLEENVSLDNVASCVLRPASCVLRPVLGNKHWVL